ncbi:MAG: lysophospholipid acyltransferase family protein, partial [Aestuariivirgaceae bacterium]
GSAQPQSPVELFSERFFRGFSRYVRFFYGRNFSGVRVLNPENATIPPDRAAVIFCNHSAWWDGIMVHLLSSTLIKDRKPFAPMDQAALQHYGFFRRVGMFGIEQDTRRGAAQFLKTSRELLARTDVALWMTPQGDFFDPRVRPIRFKPGLAHLARDRKAVLIPLAIENPFWQERKPEALFNFGRPIDAAALKQRPVGAWNKLLEDRLTETMDELAAASIERNPDPFETLIAGSVGVNPVYDAWQFAKAVATGKKFSRRHRDVST